MIWERIAAWLVGHPKVMVLVLVLIVAGSAAALPHLHNEAGISVYFDRSRPLQAVVDGIDEHFVGDDILFVAYEAEDVFAAASLRAVRDLGERVEELQLADERFAIEDVHSLATIDDLRGESETLRSEPLVPSPVPDDPATLAGIAQRATNNPLIVDRLFSRDRHSGVLVLRLLAGLDDVERAEVVARVRQCVGASALAHTEIAGQPALESDIARYQTEDVARFVPVVYGVLGLLLFLFLRRALGTLVSLISVLVALLAAFATLVVTGSSLNTTSAMLPPVVMALNVALLVHYFSEYAESRDEPRHRTLARLLVPIFVAELTTAIGFLGLASTSIPAVRGFGIAAAVAVGVAFVTSIVWLSLVTAYLPPERLTSPRGLLYAERLHAMLDKVTAIVLRHAAPIGVSAVLFVVLMLVGVARIVVDQNDITLFDASAPIRRATSFVDERLGGTTLLVATVRSSTAQAFLEPTELAKVEALESFLHDDLGAAVVDGPTDRIKLMRRELLGGAAEAFALPDTREQTAQLLLLNDDDTLAEYLDASRGSVRVVARSGEHSARAIAKAYNRIDAYLASAFPASAGYEVAAASDARLGATLADELIAGQISSTLWSAVPIVLLMFMTLRSLPLGLVSLVPNVFPIIVNFGLMGWFGIELSMATVMISTVALGIVVDDTVHFLDALKRRLDAHGDLLVGIRETAHHKSPGMVGTTLVLALVFSVLLLSRFNPTHDFALLMAIVMISALVGDLVLMPVTLVLARRAFRSSSHDVAVVDVGALVHYDEQGGASPHA